MTPEQFFNILSSAPLPRPISYRLYHDNNGRPLFYSMEDLPGQWIEIDALTYAQAPMDVLVQHGAIVVLPRKSSVTKLRPSSEGMACDPKDICLVVSTNSPHIKWSITHAQS